MSGTSAIARPVRTCPRCRGRFESDATFCPKDGARLDGPEAEDDLEAGVTPDPYLGTVIAGDISIQSVAGSGAMGRVYRAHQRGIERDVAVKILHRELSSNAQLVARFHREAKIASKLQHPHVVEVFLVGQLSDGALYMVMEFLDGVSLAGAMQAAGPLTVHRALSIALQICDAVGAGHARGIVHRDLKPENIMLVHRAGIPEWVKVLDFGIAKLTLGEQSMETAAGLIFGTARYISPEGAQGKQVGPPGDVYALATMLYQMLTGRTPFEAEPLGLLIKHLHEAPPELRGVNSAGSAVPEALARAVMDNLAKEPEQRAPNARAFGAVLAAAAREANISFADVGVVARMSHLPNVADLARVSEPGPSPSARKAALDPTVDDFAAIASQPRPSVASLAVVPAPPPPASPPAEPAAPVSSRASTAPEPRGFSARALAFVFVLGAALTAGALYTFMMRPNQERRLYEDRVRVALAEGHYITPPGENVRDLVAGGLEKWPKDAELRQLRSAAEKEMITMAIAARSSGDLVGARNLARDALALEATDNSARYMRAQCEDELAAALAGHAAKSGPPRVVFESPAVVARGAVVELTGKIVWGGSPPTEKVELKVSLLPNGQTAGGTDVVLVSADPSAIRARLTAPSPGSYDVSFEANVGGTVVRAMRDLDVIP